ncbi:hypothetical protein [Serratia ficaria]|uniref:hypothetical protein n=1 Tax=Serratia ficaria TaxID=61651 RepID=UPI0020D12977|nr:hypothetical protein [Serratia ficaria]
MHRYKASQKLAQSIPKPSILSDLLLESLGLQTDTPKTGLEEVTESFAINWAAIQSHCCGADLRIIHYPMKAAIILPDKVRENAPALAILFIGFHGFVGRLLLAVGALPHAGCAAAATRSVFDCRVAGRYPSAA